eukprot:272906_1
MENFDITHSIPWSRGDKKHEVEIRVIKTSNSIKGHHMGVVDWEKVRNISKTFILEQKKAFCKAILIKFFNATENDCGTTREEIQNKLIKKICISCD